MVKTANDEVLVMWPYGVDILGSTFAGSQWSGVVYEFNCGSPVYLTFLPAIDVNATDHVILLWKRTWYSEYWESYVEQLRSQAFSQFFNYFVPYFAVTPEYFWGAYIFAADIALRDDGRFLACWSAWGAPMDGIVVQAGISYNQLVGEPTLIITGQDYPLRLKNSLNGYWLVWVGVSSVCIQRMDTDGLPVGSPQVISAPDAICSGDPELAVSAITDNFAIVWQDARNDSGDIYCRQFNPDGSFFGNEYRVNSDPVGVLQEEPAVALGPNDQLYFTWTDFRNPGGQGDIYCKVIEWEDALYAQELSPAQPFEFTLFPFSPNPFNPYTSISYTLPKSGHAVLDVHNVLGQKVATLVDERQEAGRHDVIFDGSDLSSGIYFVRLEAGENVACRKMVLLK